MHIFIVRIEVFLIVLVFLILIEFLSAMLA
jgi:hypothetical protein